MKINSMENSLKRCLKRKVKVTLGLIVAFMITGAVGYGEVINSSTPDINGNVCTSSENWITNKWTEGIGKTKKFEEAALQLGNSTLISTANGIEIYNSANIIPNITIKSEDISNSTFLNINNAIKLGKNAEYSQNIQLDLSDDKGYNTGFNLTSKMTDMDFMMNNYTVSGEGNIYVNEKREVNTSRAENGGILVNKGNLFTMYEGQKADNGTIYNYGIIDVENGSAQKVENNGVAYNYGIMLGGIGIQEFFGIGTASLYNYGVIIGDQTCSMAQGSNGKVNAYNYGSIITSGMTAQQGYDDSQLYNYGVILNNNNNNMGVGQRVTNATAYNYGIINASTGVDNANGANYGIITNSNNFSYFNGLIKVSYLTAEYKNYGLLIAGNENIIVGNGNPGKATNNGIIVANGIDGVHLI